MSVLHNSLKHDFKAILGKSPAIMDAIMLAKRAAHSDIPVLLRGESGVGKELFAKAIHEGSNRRHQPFVAVNCGAIPETLAESILFGHEKGAFTGALYKTVGKFREADGGTLFLDEIADFPPHIQVKILRALQEGDIEPVGATRPIKVNVRVISATHKPLDEYVKQGHFREDLFYRIHVFPVDIPPLRARGEDILLLAMHFYRQFAGQEAKKIDGLTEAAAELLKSHTWPGNIRELYNSVYRAVVLCDGEYLDTVHFPHISLPQTLQTDLTLPVGAVSMPGMLPLMLSLCNEEGHFRTLAAMEEEIIDQALRYYHGQMTEAAKRLDVSRSTLYRKLAKTDTLNDALLKEEILQKE